MDDAADHPAIINPSNAASVRWKERRKPFKLLVGQPKSGAHSALPKFGSLNHILTVLGILLWVPDLSFQHDFADVLAGFHQRMRFCRLIKREGFMDDWPAFSILKQRPYFLLQRAADATFLLN